MLLLHDVRYALRTLRRQPAFSAVAVLTLALGIGATTAIFTVVDGVVLKPLRYPSAQRIVAIQTRFMPVGRVTPRTTGGDLEDLRHATDAFEAFSYYHGGEVGAQTDAGAEFVGAYRVDPDFFHVFSLSPTAGRTFDRDDAGRAAVVSASFADRHYGSPVAALRRTVKIDGVAYEIVGVMPAVLQFPRLAQVWAADSFTPSNRNRSGYNYYAVAKLRSDLSLGAANERLQALASRLAETFPNTNRERTFVAVPLRDALAAPVRSTLLLMFGAVGLVLLIACANVGNLVLARATLRTREFAVRAALGASRLDLFRQAIAESLVLACAAGTIGVGVAVWGTHALLGLGARFVPAPLVGGIHVDWRVVAFAVCASTASALMALVPAWQASRATVQPALKQAGPLGVSSGRTARFRSALIVAQVALSLMLAVDASVLFRTLLALHQASLGYRRESILVTYAHVPARTLAEALQAGRTLSDLFARLRDLPGVQSVGAAMGLPAGQYDANGPFAIEGKESFAGDLRGLPNAGFRLASPNYFATMGIPLLQGRDFADGDLYDRPFVAIVNESLARQQFAHEDPIGHRILCGLDSPRWMTIVGVVGDVRQSSPAALPGPELYMPLRQHPFTGNEVQIVTRTSRNPAALIPTVQDAVRQANPEIASKFTTMEDLVTDSMAAERFRSALAVIFAAIALGLAVSGIYAVTSYVTVRRTAEFGLRFALGAQPTNILTLVLAAAAKLVAVGASAGLLLAFAAGRLLQAVLFGVASTDAVMLAVVLAIVLPVIMLAAALPAWRASRVDPLVALRTE
jgi:putative ABC transport system permease protein